MRKSSTISTHSTPKDWPGIGDYLRRNRVQLLAADKRDDLLAGWDDISHQEEGLDDAILIGMVGGTGVGKSTFINALAGQEVSRSSDRRPTTDRVIVYRHVNTELPDDIPSDNFAQPQVMHDNDGIEKVVLFDFPDFDSAEVKHTHIIGRYLPYLDVLLVVVDDVKYADRRLYELLSTLDHDPANVFVMFNKIDRLEDRYGEKTPEVIQELIVDLNDKMQENSGLKLSTDQMFPIAALSVYEARQRQEEIPATASFRRVETMLEGFKEDKHRRAAKEKNIDARKRELTGTLVAAALGKENETILSEAKSLVTGWRGELEKSLRGVPVEILGESERRGVRRAHLRQVGPGWGLPFSLFFTLLGEFRRRSSTAVESTDLGQRVMHHYSSFFESIKNVRSRFTSEFTGSKINLSSLKQLESGDMLRVTPTALATHMQDALQQEPVKATAGRRWLAHVPAVGTLVLALWGKIHPILESAVGAGESGFIWTTVKSILGTLSPTFIIGTIVGVLIVYLLTAFVIWLREVQKLDHRVAEAEQATRADIRTNGEAAVDELDQDVRELYDEFEQLSALVG